ncbi:hypothetical protein KCU98_g225, partial [Aureobasidium melanogenum]
MIVSRSFIKLLSIMPSWLFVNDGEGCLVSCFALLNLLSLKRETMGLTSRATLPTVSCSVVVGEKSSMQRFSSRHQDLMFVVRVDDI